MRGLKTSFRTLGERIELLEKVIQVYEEEAEEMRRQIEELTKAAERSSEWIRLSDDMK